MVSRTPRDWSLLLFGFWVLCVVGIAVCLMNARSWEPWWAYAGGLLTMGSGLLGVVAGYLFLRHPERVQRLDQHWHHQQEQGITLMLLGGTFVAMGLVFVARLPAPGGEPLLVLAGGSGMACVVGAALRLGALLHRR